MGVMKVLTAKDGDKHIEWDPNDPKSVAKAEKRFNDLLGQGHRAYKVSREPTRTGQEIKKFNKDVGEYVLAPPMAGG